MRISHRLATDYGQPRHQGLTRLSGGRAVWTGRLHLDEAVLRRPYGWKAPRRVFVNSMSDVFHKDVPEAFIFEMWKVMAETPWHRYWLPTKRPERMAELVPNLVKKFGILENLWLGASVECAETVHRIECVRRTPAFMRFVSFEPLVGAVGPVDLTDIDFVFCGGESGPNARPMNVAWVDEIFAQCRQYGAGFSFLQWGAWGTDGVKRHRKANGALYRGRRWHEIPARAYAPSEKAAALRAAQQVQKSSRRSGGGGKAGPEQLELF